MIIYVKEIRVPKSKEQEHEVYVGFLNESEQAMKKLQKLAKEEDSSLIRDIEINFATASTYYKRFQAETKNNLACARLFFFLPSLSSSSDTNIFCSS